eukprot:899454-Amphidinium_carterae.1
MELMPRDTERLKTLPTRAEWRAGIERAFMDLLALHHHCSTTTSTSTSTTTMIPAWVHYAAQ